MSRQGIVDRQQACLAVIEDQAIRRRHFGAHRVATESSWIENREHANGPVKLATLGVSGLSGLARSPIGAGIESVAGNDRLKPCHIR
jgi:hypothetical protein